MERMETFWFPCDFKAICYMIHKTPLINMQQMQIA